MTIKLIRSIGTGASGSVYLAETAAGQLAIRRFESQASAGGEEWNRERRHFLDAGRQWRALRHPHIVPVLEIIDEAAEAVIEMECQTGPTLQSALEASEFTPEESTALLREIGLALDFAHQHGVVHGDLKPSNIFLLPDGGVNVSDFAISPRACPNSRIVFAGNWLHPYLSPEHLRQPVRLTAQSDRYSLGAIAYRLFTGQLPYASADLASAILQAEESRRPRRFARNFPRESTGRFCGPSTAIRRGGFLPARNSARFWKRASYRNPSAGIGSGHWALCTRAWGSRG